MSQLHFDAVMVDSHNDIPVVLDSWYRSIGRTDYFATESIPAWRAGGVDVQVLPVFVDRGAHEGALRKGLLIIEQLRRNIDDNANDVALCLTGEQISDAVASGKIAIVLALEGCQLIGEDVVLFRTFYDLGIRMASFTHMERTLFADGSAEDATGSRLTAAGVEAVYEMERLGILVDVSHLSIGGVEHVLEIVTRPVIASHSSARSLCDHHRNLSDDQIRGIAATGGVIGVNFIPSFIDRDAPTLNRIVDHFEHIAQVAGIDHVGVGPDFISEVYETMYPQFPAARFHPAAPEVDLKATIEGMTGTRDLPNLTATLMERGFSESDTRKILGENFLRVFKQVLGIPQESR